MTRAHRDTLINTFIPEGSKRTPLAGDASFRRYERITKNGDSLVLMDAPPAQEDCRPFVAIGKHLKGQGFSAPEILKADFENGLLLLEDLRDNTFNRVLSMDPKLEIALYRAAVDVLVALHRDKPPSSLRIPDEKNFKLGRYDQTVLFSELFLFPEWYLPEVTGKREDTRIAILRKIWPPLFEKVTPDNSVLTLRDYHADNLMWLPEREGIGKIGLLDFQDALLGHPAYDLVSLLQDARRPFKPKLEDAMVNYYLAQTGNQNEASFRAAYQILGAQRNTKIIGIFTRLWRRDGKAEYPAMIPHVWTLLEENLKHPALSKAKAWFDEMVPAAVRGRPLV